MSPDKVLGSCRDSLPSSLRRLGHAKPLWPLSPQMPCTRLDAHPWWKCSDLWYLNIRCTANLSQQYWWCKARPKCRKSGTYIEEEMAFRAFSLLACSLWMRTGRHRQTGLLLRSSHSVLVPAHLRENTRYGISLNVGSVRSEELDYRVFVYSSFCTPTKRNSFFNRASF